MIVIDKMNFVQGAGVMIFRENVGDEANLIKVVVNPNDEYGFFYIGTIDRDEYVIYEDKDVPDSEKMWKYFPEEDKFEEVPNETIL